MILPSSNNTNHEESDRIGRGARRPDDDSDPRIVIRGESLNIKPTPTPKTAIRHAYAEFLDQWPWQWFCSLTFEYSKHPESAKKSFRFWIKKLNREIYGCRAQKRNQSIFWALASEPHKSGNLHFHALLGDHIDLNESCSRKKAHDLWYGLSGINHIDPIDSHSERVTYYVSKYVSKGGEIDLCDHLEQFTAVQLSVLAK